MSHFPPFTRIAYLIALSTVVATIGSLVVAL